MKKSNNASGVKSKLNMIGENGYVWKNQGDRYYTVVSVCNITESYLIEYVMPKGTTALNKIDKKGEQHNFTYKQLINSKEFKKNLDISLLINNPQSGIKFQ